MNKSVKKEIRKVFQKEGINISKKNHKYFFSNWERLSTFEYLPEEVLEKHKKKVDWFCVSIFNKIMSDRFIHKHRYRLDVDYLIYREIITQDRINNVEFLRRKKIPRFELMEIK